MNDNRITAIVLGAKSLSTPANLGGLFLQHSTYSVQFGVLSDTFKYLYIIQSQIVLFVTCIRNTDNQSSKDQNDYVRGSTYITELVMEKLRLYCLFCSPQLYVGWTVRQFLYLFTPQFLHLKNNNKGLDSINP